MDPNLRRVLSHAVRTEILERISQRPCSARQLSEWTGTPLSKTTYHLRLLGESGCIRPLDPSQPDSVDRVYEISSLDGAPVRLPLSDRSRSRVLSSILRRIVDKGRAALEAGTLDDEDGHRLSCQSILLDEQGMEEAKAIIDDAVERIAETRSATAKRLRRNGGAQIRATIALAAFRSPAPQRRRRRA